MKGKNIELVFRLIGCMTLVEELRENIQKAAEDSDALLNHGDMFREACHQVTSSLWELHGVYIHKAHFS